MTQTTTSQAAVTSDLVTLTIDEVEVAVPKGTLIIRAAEQAGIQIPRFCDHPLLEPAGACRQCLVDVASPGPDGSLRAFPKPQASCTMTVSDGMVVHTQRTSAAADKAQRGVMELLLINHPLDCPICDKGGECPLQNQAMSNGRSETRFIEAKRTYPKPIRVSAEILLDRERCVLCQRCTRFSEQIAGDPFIALQQRGARQQIGRFDPEVLGFEPSGDETPHVPVLGELTEEGEPFASYFSGNTIQICPVGALTSAAYRFRARPFDLVSTESVAEHDANGSAIRVDWRRGAVLRRLAGDDPMVNEEWISDKDRFAFRWMQTSQRLDKPLVRRDEALAPVGWPHASRLVAARLAAAQAPAVLPGGRLTLEDAYAYSAFARLALHTNDIDYRARAHSSEEADFLAHHVAGAGLGVTFADLEHAPAVLLVGFEAEEEGGIVFLRLRKANRQHRTRIFSISPYPTRSLRRMNATWIPAVPGAEPAMLAALTPDGAAQLGEAATALAAPGSIIVVGERAAQVPGLLTAALETAARTGARLAWIPRRAGERAALEAGALPGLLPGGRRVSDAAQRLELERLWGAQLPSRPGRDLTAILEAAAAGQIDALVVGGLDLDDLPDPDLARRAFEACPFVVSLEVNVSTVTPYCDVVFPVAPPAEKPGTYLNWEGRPRPFGQVLVSRALSDARVLDDIARDMGLSLGLREVGLVHDVLTRLGPVAERAPAPTIAAGIAPRAGVGQAVLATWHRLLDGGSLQGGDVHLLATFKPVFARMSPATAAANGIAGAVRVSTDRGAIEVAVRLTDMPDGVVWLPTNSGVSRVGATLGAASGDVVTISPAAGGEA